MMLIRALLPSPLLSFKFWLILLGTLSRIQNFMHRYVIQTKDGLKYKPGNLEEIERLVKQGWIKPTTMVLSQSSSQWRLAASYNDIRDILQKHSPPSRSAMHPASKSGVRAVSPVRPQPTLEITSKATTSRKEACLVSREPHLSHNISMELYTIRASDGVEYGPCPLEQVKELVKQGRVKATTMVFTQSTQRWHLAASVGEVRVFLRQYNPSQDSTLNRIRSLSSSGSARDSAHAMMAVKRISTVRMKHPFWKRFFSR